LNLRFEEAIERRRVKDEKIKKIKDKPEKLQAPPPNKNFRQSNL
jgi:hypothetical protein